jgi:hypothetical protein
MQSQDKKLAQQERSKELLALSNQLFATAKTLTEYHVAELNNNMAYALSFAQTVAHQDITQLKALQSAEATKRMGVYQAKVKVILDQMDGKTSDKHLKEARSILADWYKDAKKKIPQGAEQLGQVAHEVSGAGIKAFKAGRKLINEAADAAEKSLKKVAKKEAIKATKATMEKPSVKRTPLKKVVVKKAPAKKVSASTQPPANAKSNPVNSIPHQGPRC